MKLKRLYLHLTNKCNQECRYCYNQTFRTANDHKTELTLAEFEEIIQEFSDIGVESIVFTGGAPLLSPGLLKLAAQAKKILVHHESPEDIGVAAPLGTHIVLNLKTARRIGMKISFEALNMASEVIDK